MPSFVNSDGSRAFPRGLLTALVVLVLHFAPATSASEPSAESDLHRWSPAFSIQTGVIAQTGSANLSASEVLGAQAPAFQYNTSPPCAGTPTCPNLFPDLQNGFLLRQQGGVAGEERMMTPYFSVAAELMSPSLFSGFADPRALVHADLGYGFARERDLASIGSATARMSLPDPPSSLTGNDAYNEVTITGQGAAVRALTGSLVVAGGAGLAFTFRSGERTFRFKPTVEYLREELRISATLRHATQATLQNPPHDESNFNANAASPLIPLSDDATPTQAGFREIYMDAASTKVFHGIGPGLELEMDTGRLGDFTVSLYGGARAYHFLGDTQVDFYTEPTPDENEFLAPGETNAEMRNENLQRNCVIGDSSQCENASFSFRKEPWAYTGHVGIRFRWSPK